MFDMGRARVGMVVGHGLSMMLGRRYVHCVSEGRLP
jgi:hypothetical protein